MKFISGAPMDLARDLSSLSTQAVSRYRLDSHRESVLLVEPSSAPASVAMRWLESHGYRVTWMRSEQEALEALIAPLWSAQACAPEVLLLDVDRPEVDARAFIDALPELTSRVPPIVLVAEQPASTLMQAARDAGATGFVCKPYERDDLLLTVRHSLRRFSRCQG